MDIKYHLANLVFLTPIYRYLFTQKMKDWVITILYGVPPEPDSDWIEGFGYPYPDEIEDDYWAPDPDFDPDWWISELENDI